MINKKYISKQALKEMSGVFNNNKNLPSITLVDFFDKNCFKSIVKGVQNSSYTHYSNPLSHQFSHAQLSRPTMNLMLTHQFLEVISQITKKEIHSLHFDLVKLQWKDYSILNDKNIEKPGIDIIINVTSSCKEICGGKVIYVDGSGTYTPIISNENTLTIIKRNSNVHKFFQYMNHHAKDKCRTIIIGTLS